MGLKTRCNKLLAKEISDIRFTSPIGTNRKTMREQTRTRNRTQEAPQRKGGVLSKFAEEEKKVKERIEKVYMPYRFWNNEGQECEVTILDESIESGFARPEHNLKGADGKYGNIFGCVKHEAECPLCKSEKESVLVLYLSVLVHRPYVHKKTGETRQYSKMFLCIKRGQLNDFLRVEEVAMKKHGTLRGVTILLARDHEKNSFSNGKPIAGKDGNIISDFYDEDQLIECFGHKAIISKETGRVMKAENEDITPYDYKKLMPPIDVDEFLEEHGSGPAAGSKKAYDSYKDDEEQEAEEPEDKPARTRPSSSTQPTGRVRPSSRQGEVEEDEAPRARRRAPRVEKKDEDDDLPFD